MAKCILRTSVLSSPLNICRIHSEQQCSWIQRSELPSSWTRNCSTTISVKPMPETPQPLSTFLLLHILDGPSLRTTSDLLHLDRRIYVPDSGNLCLRVLKLKHDHPLAGHFGQHKTLKLIQRKFVWPELCTFVKDYCNSFTTCKHTKTPQHKPYGLLRQLPVPLRPWESILMDLIEQLPESNGFTDILVVVDCLLKQAIFIPCHNTLDAPELAYLFVTHVFSKHGVPGHVTSDRGSEFVSRFFRSLGKILGMKLHFTSGYHLEGDGQTEQTNQTLEQYLCVYCNYQQDNWLQLLPLAEFAFNNAPSVTTGVSPFFANKGYHPPLDIHPERDVASLAATDFAVDLVKLHEELRTAMADAQDRYQGPADKRRMPPPDFKVDQLVFVKAKYFRTTRPSKKLLERYLGPFPIITQPGANTFTLCLPSEFWAVHPVFHVSMLEPHHESNIPN